MAKWLTPRMLKAECEQAIKDGFGDMPIEIFPGLDTVDVVDFASYPGPDQRATELVWTTAGQGDNEVPDFITIYFEPYDAEEDLEPL